jgi:CheY-like chemotaxis protein
MALENTVKKLLIVDDSKVSRLLIRQHMLAKKPEWIISEAASGEEAINQIEQDVPDYCTMDVNMPGMLGTDAAELILTKHPLIRIVIFSANIQDTFQDRANALGTILVAKPVTEKSITLAITHFEDIL